MEKRLTATKTAIAQFREVHPLFSDEHIIAIVEKLYPNVFEDPLIVGLEIVKELYRSQTEWTDETFVALLQDMKDSRKLIRYEIAVIQERQLWDKVRHLHESIYHDAQERTVFLSQYPEWQDFEVRNHLINWSQQRDRTLAKQLFAVLNNIALREAGEMSGFLLPFHCYQEKNGDIVFTKNRRTPSDYDEAGNPLYNEEDIVRRLNSVKQSGKSGCMGVIILTIILTLGIIMI